MNQLLVDISAPHPILAVGSESSFILGRSADQLVGRDFGIFAGPLTDSYTIKSAIYSTQQQDSSEIRTVLYDCTGYPHNVIVLCQSHILGDGRSTCCIISVHALNSSMPATSSAVPKKISKRRHASVQPTVAVVDVAYVRRVRRKHRDADRRAAAAAVASTSSAATSAALDVKLEVAIPSVLLARTASSLPSAFPAATRCLDNAISCESASHSDSGSAYDSDSCGASECTSGRWDAAAWPCGGGGGSAERAGDDGWLEQLLAVGEAEAWDPWVSDSEWLAK